MHHSAAPCTVFGTALHLSLPISPLPPPLNQSFQRPQLALLPRFLAAARVDEQLQLHATGVEEDDDGSPARLE